MARLNDRNRGTPKHVVVTRYPMPGSTVASIAESTGQTIQTIKGLNPQINDFDNLYPGQEIRYA